MTFSDRLKHLRKERGYTQASLAHALDMHERTFRGYESGNVQPSLPVLITLALHFQVSVDYLCGISNVSNPTLAEQLNLSDRAIKNLATKILHHSPNERSDIEAYSKCADMVIGSSEFKHFICLLVSYVNTDKTVTEEDKAALSQFKVYQQSQKLIEDVNKQWRSQTTAGTTKDSDT